MSFSQTKRYCLCLKQITRKMTTKLIVCLSFFNTCRQIQMLFFRTLYHCTGTVISSITFGNCSSFAKTTKFTHFKMKIIRSLREFEFATFKLKYTKYLFIIKYPPSNQCFLHGVNIIQPIDNPLNPFMPRMPVQHSEKYNFE